MYFIIAIGLGSAGYAAYATKNVWFALAAVFYLIVVVFSVLIERGIAPAMNQYTVPLVYFLSLILSIVGASYTGGWFWLVPVAVMILLPGMMMI